MNRSVNFISALRAQLCRLASFATITIFAFAFSALPQNASARDAYGSNIASIDHYVNHLSTSPALAGITVQLYVRERVLQGVLRAGRNVGNDRKAVLFVHGGTYPSVPDFDLPYKDYSWMAYLAQAGFDVFSIDITGYGKSSRPYMDDPCNVNPAQQATIIPNPLPAPCPASYPFRLTTSVSEWDDMNAVVDYIRQLVGVERVNLIGWSGGGPRIGGYAALYPEKVEKIVLLAPGYNRLGPDDPTLPIPTPGFPTNITTRAGAMGRWDVQVVCPNQYDPAIRDVIWASNMEFDPLGATWGPGVVRTRTSTSWGWNANMAADVTAPILMISGEFDMEVAPQNVRNLFADVSSQNKVFMNVECASHYIPYEYQYHAALLEPSKQWLLHGSIHGVTNGEVNVDVSGRIEKIR